MSADLQEQLPFSKSTTNRNDQPTANTAAPAEDDEDGDESEEEEEPKLKYAKLTGTLTNVYRNGDSTSAFSVAGDKMVVGTHNGSIHVLALPNMQSLKTYRAHSASVTSVSISPTPPPPVLVREAGENAVAMLEAQQQGKGYIPGISRTSTNASTSSPRTPQKGQQQQQAPITNSPNNQIYIATSSLDGHVCISSLLDSSDVQLRNFARPVNAVALSPDYKNDRTYLSGGLAGNLILTVGGKAGVSVDANTNSAAAAASGWLGAIGLGGGNTGRDTSLHSGEGAISSIKWSLSGKWVVWVNEEGIKIMRSHLRLGSEESEDAWRRIAHAARPNRTGWEDMAGVWKGRCEWIDDNSLESDDDSLIPSSSHGVPNGTTNSTASTKGRKKIEKLVVGWGDTAWILHVQSGSSTASSAISTGKRQVGSADIIHKMQFRDCIISGISFYTPSLLAILAYRTRDDDDKPIASSSQHTQPGRKGRQHRHTALAPQLRLVNVVDGEEIVLDELSRVSRFETLSAQDYHLATLWQPAPLPEKTVKEQRGKLEGLWEISGGGYATRMFTSSASVLSGSSGDKERTPSMTSSKQEGSGKGVAPSPHLLTKTSVDTAHGYALQPGLKLYLMSPYDCILSVKTELEDHFKWLLDHERYGEAWNLIDARPEVVATSTSELGSVSPAQTPSSPSRQGANGTLADFFADENSSQTSGIRGTASGEKETIAAQREKRRIGDLWLQQLVSNNEWKAAGAVAGKVLGTSSSWEHWVWTFAQADKFDEITPFIPSTSLRPPLPSLVYEVILSNYIVKDPGRMGQLLDDWDPELFDVSSVVKAIEDRLDSGEDEVAESDGEDWRFLMESLARLYLADGRAREALRAYVRLQDAEKVFSLIREAKLLDAVVDDVPGLLMLRISREQMRTAPLSELDEATAEAVKLLVEEAHRGTIPADSVVRQLLARGDSFQPFLFFYLRALWNDKTASQGKRIGRKGTDLRHIEEARALVNEHADLAVRLFAEYDRPLLLEFLKSSEVYNYDRAAEICEQRHYIHELVHILSKTGQTKKALLLIIGELGDVGAAINFAKENPDLWDDLLEYSMDPNEVRPAFVRGLLEEVGAAGRFDPVDVVRRIPEGVEIEGLKHGIQRLVREFEIQMSISEGVARVLRGEVGMGMDTLRAGRKKGVRFEVVHDVDEKLHDDVELKVHDPPTRLPEGEEALPVPKRLGTKAQKHEGLGSLPGRCVGCQEIFHELEKEPLLGFACGHVYHLSCLLDANPDTRGSKEAKDVIEQMERVAEENAEEGAVGFGGRSVGAKVAHAHVIGKVVKEGCRRCGVVEGA